MSKQCTRCGKIKSIEEFNWRNKAKGTKQSHCAPCCTENKRKTQSKYREVGLCRLCGKRPRSEHSQDCPECREKKIRTHNERRMKYKRRAIDLYGGCCSICGEKTDVLPVYVFHHLEGSNKEDELSEMFGKYGWDKILVELEKCILVCANCHAKIHAGAITEEEDLHNYVSRC